MIEIRGLRKNFGPVTTLHAIDLKIPQGQFTVILGPSGAGKSTLLRCINRLVEPTAGEIRVDGVLSTSRPNDLRRLRRSIGMVFQGFDVIKRMSVLTNVLQGRLSRVPSWLSLLRVFPKHDVDLALACLGRVELSNKAWERTDTLSGGQLQRVGIARALAQEPNIILADEPVASLDPRTARTVLALLRQAAADLGITVLCNLHQVDLALEFGERIIGLASGRIVVDGPVGRLTPAQLQLIYAPLDQPLVPTAAALQPECSNDRTPAI